ncbi:MAG: hypothetical protein K6G07_08165 [Lachnospiraceae bacterium]|nr:hypothetical protein [Lachnospiraceae bacterium]
MSKMVLPNVVKFTQFSEEEQETVIIDSNERIAERIAELSRDLQDSLGEDEDGTFADGFSEGLDADQVSALLDDDGGNVIKAEPVYEGPSPEELIAEAQEQIDAMLQQAQEEANNIREQARKEGFDSGFIEGQQQGLAEAQAVKQQYDKEHVQEEARLKDVYQKKIRELEPELVDLLTDIYEHIFNVSLSDQKDLIVHLIKNALQKTDSSKEYLLHVSSDDYAYVGMQKKEIMDEAGITNASFEVIEDATMKKGQCMIETESGIFDCSLGVELKELKKQLVLLSFEGIEKSEGE